MVSACVSFLDERKVIDVVMKRCQKISGDIQSLLRTSQVTVAWPGGGGGGGGGGWLAGLE